MTKPDSTPPLRTAPATNMCCIGRQVSFGVPLICELPKGHIGRHAALVGTPSECEWPNVPPAAPDTGASEEADRHYGKDCPVGMVQVEFVGAHAERRNNYGWKPGPSAFLELYVDGRRYRVDVGTFHDGVAERRGLHIVGSIDLQVEKTAMNAAPVFIAAPTIQQSLTVPAATGESEPPSFQYWVKTLYEHLHRADPVLAYELYQETPDLRNALDPLYGKVATPAATTASISRDFIAPGGADAETLYNSRRATTAGEGTPERIARELQGIAGEFAEETPMHDQLDALADQVRALGVASRSTEAPVSETSDDAAPEFWEAECRRILRALTAEGVDVTNRVTSLALKLRPPNQQHPPTAGRSTEAGAGTATLSGDDLHEADLRANLGIRPTCTEWLAARRQLATLQHQHAEAVRVKEAETKNANYLHGELMASRAQHAETCDCTTLRERLTGVRAELREIGALFGITPCTDDRPTSWTNGENGSTALVEMLRPIAALRAHHAERLHGVTWLLIRDGFVLLEKCPKKAQVLGVGEWFVPGGKIDGDETAGDACIREMREEWGVRPDTMTPLPIIEGSRIPPGPRGLFLMRPFVVTVAGELPSVSGDGVVLRWTPITQALASPVPQVRMMLAAALSSAHQHAEQEERIAADTARLDWLESTLDEDDVDNPGTTLWLDGEVPEGVKPSVAISGTWAGNQRGSTLRKAIDAGIAEYPPFPSTGTPTP